MKSPHKTIPIVLALVIFGLQSTVEAQNRKPFIPPHDTCGSSGAKLSVAYQTFVATALPDSYLMIVATPAKGESKKINVRRIRQALDYLSSNDRSGERRLLGAITDDGTETSVGYLTLFVNGKPIDRVIVLRNTMSCGNS